MDEPEPTIGEIIATALAKALVRKGVLDRDDIAAATDELSASAEPDDQTAAHVLRCAAIEAEAPTASEWGAERARARFRVIEGGEE
ncbi:hypothetical protein GCM10023232_27230 [Sphingosinicella ginsenosidimutans]|uniref:Nitrile hydratase subunit beta n=1 Tax=Allosphingosinicella ginsenosidimutans TaxID=1176539 RepID=A0A5C6TUV9_9SPHN|nr:nitrile hydratase subunit beta [Sphingosinicella ginsenosidimutans]TXC63675.1 nitrile hydratase subunit beta [Sphingosinicella ginsenosidimutans]